MGGGLIAGVIAVVVGGGLAVATTVGVVKTVNKTPKNTDASVVDYGSKLSQARQRAPRGVLLARRAKPAQLRSSAWRCIPPDTAQSRAQHLPGRRLAASFSIDLGYSGSTSSRCLVPLMAASTICSNDSVACSQV